MVAQTASLCLSPGLTRSERRRVVITLHLTAPFVSFIVVARRNIA
ncbi:MAG TPA: hypothetical protein VF703_00020 [Pyrinomonadaceae bacterium]